VTIGRELPARNARTVYWVDASHEGVNRRLRETIEAGGVRVVPLESTAALLERLADERRLRLVGRPAGQVELGARVRVITNRNRPEDGGEEAAAQLVAALAAGTGADIPVLVFTLRRERAIELEGRHDRVLVATGIGELLRFALDESLADLYARKRCCAICGAPQTHLGPGTRYPRGVCAGCVARAVAEDGEPIAFVNTGPLGQGCARRRESGRLEDVATCLIDGVPCRAEEARFGGIVVQVADPD
jgi:hypothetical protein